MRTSTKKRLQYFVVAAIVYILGFQFIPESLNYDGSIFSLHPLLLAITGYFILLPVLYWLWVIKAGKQKAWKILLALSLSSLCARYSFPQDIAQYFEFIMYLRYPLIAILLVVELYLMVTIIKGLWGARKLSGDPRLHTLTKYQDDEKKLLLALPMAWEPASWYYAIPKFSRKHNQALCQLVTRSRLTSHWLILIGACFAIGSFSYYLLVDWSEITAFILASFSFYSIIFVTANHRVAKNYSVYLDGDKLVINNAFWSFIMINVKDIKTVNQGLWSKADDKEQLMLGRGSHANIELCFSVEQTYLATMGQFPEKISKLWLHVDQPEQLLNQLKSAQQSTNRPSDR
ncbi:MAG: hypothetical protein HRT52_05505 [Colwellia sp.]|nr:hypothetical protein [Colwellia sp.]